MSDYTEFKEYTHWRITNKVVYEAWANIVFSLLGYATYGFIVYSMHRDGILRRYMHNVFLIIAFAIIVDLAEFRMNFVIVSDLQYKQGISWSATSKLIPASLTSCTVAELLYYAQFLISTVEMIVAIHYFVVRFCGKPLTVKFIYAGLGLIFAMAAMLFAATFAYGDVMGAYIYCTKAYVLVAHMRIAVLIWLASLFVAPVLCGLWIVKAFVTKQRYSGVTAFILSSSSVMSLLVLSYIFRQLAWRASYYHVADPWYVPVSKVIFIIAYYVHEFRLLILCLIAISLVREIRDSVVATVMIVVRYVFGLPEPSTIIANEVFLESLEENEKNEKNAIPGAAREWLLYTSGFRKLSISFHHDLSVPSFALIHLI